MRPSDPPLLPIIAGSKIEQLRPNIAALDLTLSTDQMRRLDAARQSCRQAGVDTALVNTGESAALGPVTRKATKHDTIESCGVPRYETFKTAFLLTALTLVLMLIGAHFGAAMACPGFPRRRRA